MATQQEIRPSRKLLMMPGSTSNLNSAKALSRRLGISYKELVELILTGFINPKLDALVILRKLGLDLKDIYRYKRQPGYQRFTAEEEVEFEDRLRRLTKTFSSTSDFK